MRYTEINSDLKEVEQTLFNQNGKSVMIKAVEENITFKLQERYLRLVSKRQTMSKSEEQKTHSSHPQELDGKTKNRSSADDKNAIEEKKGDESSEKNISFHHSDLTNESHTKNRFEEKQPRDQTSLFPVFKQSYERKKDGAHRI